MPEASPFIFISYSRSDQVYARKLRAALEEYGLSVWMDDRIDFGQRWEDVIEENLSTCNAFVLLMTPRSEQSTWVGLELGLARRLEKPIFPVLLENASEKTSWWQISNLQISDVTAGGLPNEKFFQDICKVCLAKRAEPKIVEPEIAEPVQRPEVVRADINAKRSTLQLNRRTLLIGTGLSGGFAMFTLFGAMLNRSQKTPDNNSDLGAAPVIDSLDNEEPDNSNTDTDMPVPVDTSDINVGILHSLSGTMAINERSLVDAEELAIEQLNATGGVLGRQIAVVKEDGASDWPTFAEKAKKLIDQDEVAVVFGCWTSASRKAVLPVFQENDHMLWYPVQYEGQECSKNVFYTGAAPNQQIEPAVDWLLENKGTDFFLVGSDYVFPRTANNIIKAQLKANGGTTAGEDYLPVGNLEVTPIISKIKQALPNGGVIFSTLAGDSNVAFFKRLKSVGMGPDKYPVMSVSIAEEEVRQIGPEFLEGHYAAWNYFQTVESPENETWVADFKAKYGNDRVTSDPMEAAYIMVYLWAQAVEKAGTTDIPTVREAAYGQTFAAPEGRVTMRTNHHLSKTVRIGRVRNDGLFEILFDSNAPIEPVPWNQYVPETQGYGCDWSDPQKGEMYKI